MCRRYALNVNCLESRFIGIDDIIDANDGMAGNDEADTKEGR